MFVCLQKIQIVWKTAPFSTSAALSGDVPDPSDLTACLESTRFTSSISMAVSLLTMVLIISFIAFFLHRQRTELKDKDDELASTHKEIIQKNAELKERLTELTRVKDYNENLLKSMNSGVVVINFECFVITFNKAAETILGLPKQEVVGTSIFDHSEFSGLYELLIDTLKTERSYIRHEIWVRSRDKRDVPLGVSTSVLKDRNDDSMGIIAIFRDLTEIKELERKVEQAKRLASLGEMAAGVAHEIRNPLNPIRGFAQMIAEDLDPDDGKRKYSRIIIEQVDHLSKIVNDLLDFAKYVDLDIRECSVPEVIEETLRLLSEGGDLPDDVEVQVQCHDPIPVIPADPKRLQQVFINLFQNAVDAMEAGGALRIEAGLEDGIRKAGVLKIEVADTGPGIGQDHLLSVFNPFFTTKGGGTGLGLSITYGIIERHGGTISVANAHGGGAVFTILLPLEEDQKVKVGL